MPTSTDLQNQILYELAFAMPGGPVFDVETTALMTALQTQMPTIWAIYNGKAALPLLQFYYVKREAIDTVLGQLRLKRDGTLGQALRMQGNQLFQHVIELRKGTQEEILRIEAKGRANQPPCIGKLVLPVQPIPGYPDVPPLVPMTTYANAGGATVATTQYGQGLVPNPGDPQYDGSDPRIRPSQVLP